MRRVIHSRAVGAAGYLLGARARLRRSLTVFVAATIVSFAGPGVALASPLTPGPSPMLGEGRGAPAYAATLTGSVIASRLSGVEPDGDPLYQVVLKTRLTGSGSAPTITLIVSSYLENFQPDTTPILPDLLHPNQNAQNLGGFLQGKALLTDDAGTVLSIGSFVAEAFLDNTNHAAMTLSGAGAAFGISGKLLGSFTLHKDASLTGRLSGHLSLPPAARKQLLEHRGARMRPIKDIISQVTVKPHPMVGLSSGGAPSTPLPIGFAPSKSSTGATRHVNPWSIVAGVGAVLSLLLAGVLYVIERRKKAGEMLAASQQEDLG